jgi:hypothetical protein
MCQVTAAVPNREQTSAAIADIRVHETCGSDSQRIARVGRPRIRVEAPTHMRARMPVQPHLKHG